MSAPRRFRFDQPTATFRALDGVVSYTLIQHLKSGGYGAVFLAKQIPSGRIVALKTLKPDATQDHKKRLSHEAQSYRLHERDPHVLKLVDADLDCSPPFICTEFMDGGSLRDSMAQPHPDWATAYIGEVVGSVLKTIHEGGGFHRDVNPNNIFVDRSTKRTVYKLGDFGLAMEPEARSAQTFSMRGTPGYIAPEVSRTGVYGAPADIFSLGVTLFELSTGIAPQTVSEYDVAKHALLADSQLRELINQMTHPKPEKRPSAVEASERCGAIRARLLGRQAGQPVIPAEAGYVFAAILIGLGAMLAAVMLSREKS